MWHKITGRPIFIIIFVICLDQVTKYMALNSDFLMLGGHYQIIPGFFSIIYVTNTGAAFGILPDATGVLALISFLAFIFLLYHFQKVASGYWERGLAVSLIMGGIAGNLIDRVFRQYVIDFFSFYYQRWEWPAFNIADSAICIGAAIYTLSSLLRADELSHDSGSNLQGMGSPPP